jgi:peptidoglycan/LPS O-acetylase OafA/YrhL
MNVGIALLVDHCVRYPHHLVGRFLNARPVVAVGLMSYSLYLWQQLFLRDGVPAFQQPFPVNLALTFAAGFASYRLVERPSLRLRQAIERAWGRSRARAGAGAVPVGVPQTTPAPPIASGGCAP